MRLSQMIPARVNRAIADLHGERVVASTSLMARATATAQAVEIARATPALGVGCHVVLVDGEPVLSPRDEIPHLADPIDGRFRSSLVSFLFWLYAEGSDGYSSLNIRQGEIEAEAGAQIVWLQDHGLTLTHIDTHKHLHMFPAVLRPVLRAARAAGIHAVRNPFEPAWAISAFAGASWARIAEVTVLKWLEPICRQIIREEGFVTTDGTIAVVGTGILNAATLRFLLERIPDGTWELVAHPGYNDGDLARVRTRLRASREVEREALLTIRQFPEIELISYADLLREHPEPVL
jgi:chitin disaccharide deacetylase